MTDPAPVGYYEWLDFNSPMTGRTADDLVARLADDGPRRVLDVGCGWAELLLRLLVACPDATGLGVDHDEALIDRARRNADRRDLGARVAFETIIASPQDPADLVINVGAEHVFGDLDAALGDLRPLVRPGGRLLLGTQFWERRPSPDLNEAFGPIPTLDELMARVAAAGWRPLGLRVATLEDWDDFEFRYMGDWEQFVMNPPSVDDADRARHAADDYRAAYLERRGVLGFAYLTLGRPLA